MLNFNKSILWPLTLTNYFPFLKTNGRKITEKLWDSLSPNNSTVKLSKQEESILEQRWEKYISGKTKFYSSKEMQRKVLGKK